MTGASMRRRALVLGILIGFAAPALAAELNVRKAFTAATCASPPCTACVGFVPSGPKTVSVENLAGTATVDTRCKYVTSTNTNAEVFSTLTGGVNAFEGFGLVESCGDLCFVITACTGCSVNAAVQSQTGF